MGNKRTKVLLINGYSIGVQNATGITMRSIFNNWDNNNWFEVSCSPSSVDSTYLSKQIYALPHKCYPIYYLLSLPLFKKANSISKDYQTKTVIAKGKNTFSNILRRILISYADALPLFPPVEMLKKVREFKPDCIYTLGSSILSMKLALYFSKKLNIKIVLHCMDNWQDTLYTDFLAVKPCHLLMRKVLRKVYDRVDIGLTISEKMASEYTARWNKKHLAIMNTVTRIEEKPAIRNDEKQIIFTYAGGLHLERWKSLQKICNAIKAVNANSKIQSILNIYTSDEDKKLYSYLFDEKVAVFYDYVPHDQINIIYQSSDVLVHIESFDAKIYEFIKYSLSTKISEYMASGKPILLFAPKDIAVSEYIEKNEAGLTCGNELELYNTVNQLAASKELRFKLSLNAINCVKKYHTIDETERKIRIAFGET